MSRWRRQYRNDMEGVGGEREREREKEREEDKGEKEAGERRR